MSVRALQDDTSRKSSSSYPAYYHRQYENDLKEINPGNPYWQLCKRVALVALPFISLYKPLGSLLSIGMNITRTFSCITLTFQAFATGDRQVIGAALFQTAIATASIAEAIFSSTAGMVITSGHDVVISLYEILQHIASGDYQQAFEGLLQLTNNSLYLAMLLYGSLEIIALSMLAQMLLGLYKSQSEFRSGCILEGISQMAMAGIRAYQMQPQLKMLKFKWDQQKLMKEQMVIQPSPVPTTTANRSTSKMAGIASGVATIALAGNSLTQENINKADPELVDILIKYGNNPDGIPVLHNAILSHDLKAVKILVEKGADVNSWATSQKDYYSQGTPMAFAVKVKDLDIMKYLLSHDAKLYADHVEKAALCGFLDGLNFLLENKAPFPSNSGQLLCNCLWPGSGSGPAIAKCLIIHGADCKYTSPLKIYGREDESLGLLSLAVPTRDLELVKLLVEHGAPINYCLNDFYLYQYLDSTIQHNPLYEAVNLSLNDISKYLVSRGAVACNAHQRWFQNELEKNLDLKKLQILLDLKMLDNIRVQNLFQTAIKQDALVAVSVLFAAGAKIQEGHLVLAAKTKDKELVSWLVEHGAKF